MTKNEIKLSKEEIKLLMEQDTDFLKPMVQFVVQEVLEAERSEIACRRQPEGRSAATANERGGGSREGRAHRGAAVALLDLGDDKAGLYNTVTGGAIIAFAQFKRRGFTGLEACGGPVFEPWLSVETDGEARLEIGQLVLAEGIQIERRIVAMQIPFPIAADLPASRGEMFSTVFIDAPCGAAG